MQEIFKPVIRFVHPDDGHNGKETFNVLFAKKSDAVGYASPMRKDYDSEYKEATIDVDAYVVFESAQEARDWQKKKAIESAKSKLSMEEIEALGLNS